MNYHQLPKIDLHCHLDGSTRPQTIIDLAKQQGIKLVSQDPREIKKLIVAPETCANLDEYLQRFALPNQVMQTAQALERITFEVFEDAAQENVTYLEIRFAPLLHTQGNLSIADVIESVIKGMQRAHEKYGIYGNIILCALRHLPNENYKEMLTVGAHYLQHNVVGFDIAGSEMDNFAANYIDLAHLAQHLGFRVTIHAGEQGCGQNVLDSIMLLGAQRIGHGIAITQHQPAYSCVKDKNIGVETCPTSNLQTKSIGCLSDHPVRDFFQDGLSVTINTDNRTVSNTTMTDEVRKVIETFHFSLEDYFHIYRYSVAQSFASEDVKTKLLKII